MDITICQIDRSAIGLSLPLQGMPLIGAEYFVNHHPSPVPCHGKIVNRPFGMGFASRCN
jgi:hypothetical protein